jgi:hypothetical protein
MFMSEVGRPILDTAVSWHDCNNGKLASLGVEARLVDPTPGRSKNSAAVEFASPDCLIALTIWDLGACGVITSSVKGR